MFQKKMRNHVIVHVQMVRANLLNGRLTNFMFLQ
jgi:hypothetical protein